MLIATSVEKVKTSAEAFINIITVNNRIPIYFLEFLISILSGKGLRSGLYMIVNTGR